MAYPDPLLPELRPFQQNLLNQIQTHWKLFFFEGAFFIALGAMAIVIPQFFSVVAVLFLGWLILIGGAFQIGRALYFSGVPGFVWWLGLGVLQLLVGFMLVANPIAGLITLTMLMTVFFALEGVIKIYLALMMRPLPHWQYVLFSGITALLFAVIIMAFWSETVQWLLGLFLGINMILLGIALVKMCLEHKPVQS
jgi:uncharacterized membrane protein HdeD (DUF308 family)